MKSTLRADLAAPYERAESAIEQAHKLHEDYCFIVSWRHMQPAPNVRHTSLLDENGNGVQHAASPLNDAIGGAATPPNGGRDREIKLAAFARETLARYLTEIDPVHSA